MTQDNTQSQKSERALNEEATLTFWKEKNIFEKTLSKESNKGEYVFYEGPPTANAKPALHHLEARAFKDVIPRYKTMQGYHVPRRAGWDTHGLPVELQIEKSLGLQSKKDIEGYGVAAFNKACKESVFTYIKDWENFTDRMGYWVDKKSAYYTFNSSYMESLWNIVAEINKRNLLYKDYKVVPWCPRCGTGLSSHELAQGYQDVKDLSVTAKFKVVGQENTYILAWTTTPWTLPGNVALAVGNEIDYIVLKVGEEKFILAKERLSLMDGEYEVVSEMKGSDLVGLEYEPLYPYLKTEAEKKGLDMSKAFHVYAADFVTTSDGTGVVHIAPMYGADDFDLGTKIGLPKFHTVNEGGHFIQGTDFLEGRFVKDEEVAVDIIKDLAHRGQLFKKEKYEHSYPHCWRCKTPLLYYARDSWYVRMSELRDDLLAANQTINWEPEHIKEGRFGEWLREVKDWAFSRERYWGTPLPVWFTDDGEKVVIDSIDTLKSLAKKSDNKYFVMRHGQTDHNVRQEWNATITNPDPLTEKGVQQIKDAANAFSGEIDMIITSPFSRTKESAQIFRDTKNLNVEIIEDSRIAEWNVGAEFDGKPFSKYFEVRNVSEDRYGFKASDGESYLDILKRAGEFIYDLESKYKGKRILIMTHGAVARALELHSTGVSFDSLYKNTRDYKNFENADLREINFVPLPHNENFELDLHKPYIDEVELYKDGKKLTRVKEVMDVWFDSGSMPFAQEHYMGDSTISYPADFISEAIDQTRGWFYTLLAVGVLMGKGTPYKNVICLGHLLDKDGKKMSKSIGNIVEPFEQMDKFGVDAVRWWMYSVNAPGESKNYDEKNVAEINNKVFNLFNNVLSFYELYRDKELEVSGQDLDSSNVLDQWIVARLNQIIAESTKSLDTYDLFKPTRTIREFIDDLSTWYLRRSRDRIKNGDKEAKQTLYHVLKTTAKIMAPFAPFFAEYVWQKLKSDSDEESIHLSVWPEVKGYDQQSIDKMMFVRALCTIGNAHRKHFDLPVRQPLATLFVNSSDGAFIQLKNNEKLLDLVKEELNVKNVIFAEETKFDTEITPELKLEGEYRELVRLIQDMRKEKGLTPQEEINLTLSEKYTEIFSKFGEDLKKTVGAKEVIVKGEEVIIG
jgi:isoleucyl-tRNA synthetase